jgi:hypothetical protein
MSQRDEFSGRDKWVLAKRVGLRCSNPRCRKLTAGPNDAEARSTSIGVAAHITAAAPGGPRYSHELSVEQRKSLKNAIWLCQSCARLVDDDMEHYSIATLHEWKAQTEQATRAELESSYSAALVPRREPAAIGYAKVLLPEVDASFQYVGSSSSGITVDYSVYPFVIEELISVGALSVAVVRGTGQEKAVQALSKYMVHRVTVIDPAKVAAQLETMFDPIATELRSEFSFPGIPIVGISAKQDGEPLDNEPFDKMSFFRRCAGLYPALFKIILGMEHGLQIEVDLEQAKEALTFLRENLKTRGARDILAIISGLLSSYHSVPIDTIEPSRATNSQMLQQLFADSSYQQMAIAAYDFGVAERVEMAKRIFEDSAKSLLDVSWLGGIIGPASRLLQLAKPRAQRNISNKLPYGGFLPPILPFDLVRRRAQETWLRIEPTPIGAGLQLPNDIHWSKRSFK